MLELFLCNISYDSSQTLDLSKVGLIRCKPWIDKHSVLHVVSIEQRFIYIIYLKLFT